jgi:hypothetical protein
VKTDLELIDDLALMQPTLSASGLRSDVIGVIGVTFPAA